MYNPRVHDAIEPPDRWLDGEEDEDDGEEASPAELRAWRKKWAALRKKLIERQGETNE